jgi:RNA polymerase sigma factor (TIGR02999 family)
MSSGPFNPITQLLAAVGQGDAGAQDQLWAAIYNELRQLAHHQLRPEPIGPSLQTTVLVHEAYLRLLGDAKTDWANRRHFFAAAAQAMRRIRVDDARKRNSLKRGGGHAPELHAEPAAAASDDADLLALDEALKKLEQDAPRQAEIVMLRYFAGLNVDETAQALDVSPRTVDTDWRLARAWLHRELSPE